MISIKNREEDAVYEVTVSTYPFHGTTKKVYWGWMGTGDMLTEAQIVVLQGSGDIQPSAKVVADFRGGNTAPMFLYMVERESEPAKTIWYNNELDNGQVGPGHEFSAIGVVNGWRVYRSTFKTQFSTVTEFRIN